ncbi:MAG TPA: acyltransferase [Jatrophihabitans sp.]|nr:acyltransferase [Jatrophihabitans sp.]
MTRARAGGARTARTSAPDHSAFPALDGIRALAVAAVVATHAAYATYRYGRGPGAGLLVHLDSGVALFFVISGFLLCRPWLLAAARGEASPQVRVYLWRRALRILPAYWVALTFAFVTLQDNRDVGLPDIARHLGFAQIYRFGWMRAGLTQTWSLCTEVAFYLVLPFLGAAAIAVTRRIGWRPGVLLGLCGLLGAITVGWLVWTHANGWALFGTANLWLPGYLTWFAGGMAMAVLEVHLATRPVARHGRWRAAATLGASPGVCWLVAAGLFLVAATPVDGPYTVGFATTTQAIVRNLLYTAFAMLVVWPAVFGPRTWASAVFANRPMRWLGDISYGVFLLHLVVLDGVMHLLGYPLWTGSATAVFLLTCAGTVPLAALLFRYVERPANSLRRLVPARPRLAAPGGAQAAPAEPAAPRAAGASTP